MILSIIFLLNSVLQKKKKYNIEILINDELNNTDIAIVKENEKIPVNLNYNDLNISRIIILNTDLDFKLYLLSKLDSQLKYKNEIKELEDEIIQNLYKEKNKISPESEKK